MNRFRIRSRVVAALACAAPWHGAGCSRDDVPPRSPAGAGAASPSMAGYPSAFAGLGVWDDGLSEMSYYDAVDTIYGAPRRYTRVLLFNREWFDPTERVKLDAPQARPDAVPVFKLNIVEEVPTENYNYRFMTTVFLHRATLGPEKAVYSSQEWCGTTFKSALWQEGETRFRGFSYFGGEGDREWSLPAEPPASPEEALFVIARAAVAADRDLDLHVLPPMRSNRLARGDPAAARLTVHRGPVETRVPAGRFPARTASITIGARALSYTVERDPPYRLLAFDAGPGERMELRFVERRPYWDRSSPSGFHQPGAAP